MKRRNAAVCLCAVLALAVQSLSAASGDELGDPRPDASLGPDEVVRIQLEALRGNDASDRGIAICFRFASPDNKASTGPVERFGQMIKNGVYALMLDYEDVQYDPVEVMDGYARQRVTLIGATRIVKYAFYLSRQSHPACDGCWMTDSVTPIKVSSSDVPTVM